MSPPPPPPPPPPASEPDTASGSAWGEPAAPAAAPAVSAEPAAPAAAPAVSAEAAAPWAPAAEPAVSAEPAAPEEPAGSTEPEAPAAPAASAEPAGQSSPAEAEAEPATVEDSIPSPEQCSAVGSCSDPATECGQMGYCLLVGTPGTLTVGAACTLTTQCAYGLSCVADVCADPAGGSAAPADNPWGG